MESWFEASPEEAAAYVSGVPFKETEWAWSSL
jgi:hypothetical protein